MQVNSAQPPAPPGLPERLDQAGVPISAQYLLCDQLDRHLRQLLQAQRFFAPPVREARKQLRDAYVSVLLTDYRLSQVRSCDIFECL